MSNFLSEMLSGVLQATGACVCLHVCVGKQGSSTLIEEEQVIRPDLNFVPLPHYILIQFLLCITFHSIYQFHALYCFVLTMIQDLRQKTSVKH